jgi:two-component system chemotaxis response regulator CheY
MRLLIVEDDPSLAETLADVLADEGHEVQVAEDGTIGWQLLHEMPTLPEVLLLDLMMPGMDGQSFRRRQVADPRLASIPTLVITGQPVSSRGREALGSTPVMNKPLALANLLAALAEIVQTTERAQKKCSCGRIYGTEEWRKLPLVGTIDNGRNAGEQFELRNCGCRSTLAWQLGPHAVSMPPLG